MKSGTRRKYLALTVTFATLTALAPAKSHAAVTFQKIALTGEPAIGALPGMEFTNFLIFPSINNAGQVVFKGSYTIPGDEPISGQGIWAGVPGSLRLVAEAGDEAPGAASDVTFTEMDHYPVINDNGQVAFYSGLIGPGVDDTNDRGLWSEGSGTLELIARTGDAVPGMDPGVTYSGMANYFGVTTLNSLGQSAFRASFSGPGIDDTNNNGILSGGAGSLSMLVRTGDPATGTEAGTVFSELDSKAALNKFGQTMFEGTLSGPGIDDTNDTGIWTASTNALNLVVREGDAAPGIPGGAVFIDSLRSSNINGSGEVSFFAVIDGPDVTGGLTDGHGIWSEGGGQLHLVARAGDPAPGTGEVFSRISSHVINDNGQTAYQAYTSSSRGIWLETNGTSQLIARTGVDVPGADPGVEFRGFNGGYGPLINNAGQVAFRGELTGTGMDTSQYWGIWATDPGGNLTKIVRMGELFDVNDDPLIDDLRTISYVDLLFHGADGTHNGMNTSFNDAGQIAFRLGFTDGTSGHFVANTRLTGDFNGDGFVGLDDLDIVLNSWNQAVTPWDFTAGDATGDGYVGLDDLDLILGNWNTGSPPSIYVSTTIPEPVTLVLLGVPIAWISKRFR